MADLQTTFCGRILILFLSVTGLDLSLYSTQAGTLNRSINSDRQHVIDELFSNYDGSVPPNMDNAGDPVAVTVQVHLMSIDSISETNMDFASGMFLRQSWNDTRLVYSHISKMKRLELDTRQMGDVWVPDLFIPSEKRAAVHDVTVPNKLMHIYPDGRVQYSQRVSATLKCNFDLRKYPMDSQTCSIEMESYGYTTNTLVFRWHQEESVIVEGRFKIPQFSLGHIHTEQCDKVYVGVGYTCVGFTFELHRSMGYYLTQMYVPSVLIVMLSWVSFWLDHQAVPARISLGLLTVLTMTTQSSGARASLPKVSYVKAIDVWMATCLVFVFLALLQFAYVNVLSRVHSRRAASVQAGLSAVAFGMKAQKKQTPEETESLQGTDVNNGAAKRKWGVLRTKTSAVSRFISPVREKARNVDRVSRVLFPTAFIVFNIVYWCVYQLWQPDHT